MSRRIRHGLRNERGFSLPELLMAVLILVPIFLGVLLVYVQCMEMSELSRNSSSAVWASRNRISEIQNTAFAGIFAAYHNTTFAAGELTGRGVSYVDNSNADLLEVTVSFSWRQKSGRIIGEDLDLDGQLDAGEDTNGNGRLDSPVAFTTRIYDS